MVHAAVLSKKLHFAFKAVEIIEAYEGTLEDDFPPDNECCEHGEMLLYKLSISFVCIGAVTGYLCFRFFPTYSCDFLLEESGSIERALDELHKKEPKIVDKLAFKEQEVSLLVKLGHFEEGATLFKALLSMNPDNYGYYEGLHKCVGLYSENGQYSPD
ncbi:N-terminal acetyltransferase A complex auxiliary subunit NAA15-like [Humulus lupulus]|uniref:N-terminal acetyltransferase A complex auxiliary subunit NAA15-like n=1 Tax=Humulus lupulus TaxID=3486 RepID=UPI002B416E96|nr:N-terminal acetyltransferase A complex auxiliary subunit NAA15-like [Humulus lupulus]